jgi:hypothetical protein
MHKNETFEWIYSVFYLGIFGLAILLAGWMGR